MTATEVKCIFKEITDFSGLQFEKALSIYSSSFPPVETKPTERVVSMLRNDSDYHLYVAMQSESVVGMSLLYVFRDLRIGLLDYMAVAPEYQRKGIGTKLFTYILDKFRNDVTDPVGLLLEVQREDVSDPKQRRILEDRIRFYAHLGAKILDGVDYLLPPQHGTEPERTYLMIVPLKTIDYLFKTSVLRYIQAVYLRVYQYERTGLLDATAEALPNTIKLSEIHVTRSV